MTTRVGFIGAGQMGMPMVERLAAAGTDLTVFARRPATLETLAAAGIAHASSAEGLAASVDILILCLFDDRQLAEVLFGAGTTAGALAALRPGAVLVNHTTGSPAVAVRIATEAPSGVGVVDAPVSGTAEQIRAGTLTVLAGSRPGDLETVRPTLACYASSILPVGGVGDGQRIKLVNNLVFTAHLRVAALAAELAGTLGVAPDALARAVGHCSGTSLPMTMLETVPLEVMVASARPFLAKDVAVIREVAAGLGVGLGPLGELAAWVDPDPDR